MKTVSMLRVEYLGRGGLLAAASVLLMASGWAQDEKKPTLGEVIVQTVPAKHYLHGGFETKFKDMGAPVGKTLTELTEAAKEQKVGLHGPVVHFYFGAPHQDPEQQFRMETGFYVAEGVESAGMFKARKLPEFKCATIIYVGPAAKIGKAWQKLYRSLRSRGLKATKEERELYLYWEGADSPNNIVQVQVGVE